MIDYAPIPSHYVPIVDNTFEAPSSPFFWAGTTGWIVDACEQRVLWIPPDMRGGHNAWYGPKWASGPENGKVVIVDFSALSDNNI